VSLGAAQTATASHAAGAQQLFPIPATGAPGHTSLQQTNERSAQLGSDLLKVSIVSPARVPSRPSFPQVTLIEMFVIFASFVATSLVVVARELHDRGFATVEEIERQHKVRRIGIMLSLARDENGQCKINEGIDVFCLNMLNAIWSRLCRVGRGEKSNVFMVTSSVPEEGKTTTALAVARTGARHGARVLVVDCDLIHGDLTQRVKAGNVSGLGEVLRGRADWRQSLVKDPASSVDVLASGIIGEQLPSLDVPVTTTLLEKARREYDLVLLDTPPVLGLWDAECLSRLSDATILLVRWQKTPQRVFANALRHVSGGPVFCLLSRVDLLSRADKMAARLPADHVDLWRLLPPRSARVPKLVFFNTVTRLSLKLYDSVVACSEADAQLFGKITRGNLVTIENGADIDKFRTSAARTPQRVLVCFGRFASNKRIETLFPLLRELRRINPAWKLIAAGAETDVSADFLEAEAQNAGVQPAVTISVRPSDTELRGLIGQATYFICASSYEGFGIAAVEALSAGLVPILTSIPPFAWLLRKAGLGVFYDPDDPVAEARRIEEMTSIYDGHLRGAAMHAAASYGWEAVTASYVDLYRHLAARSRAWPHSYPALP